MVNPSTYAFSNPLVQGVANFQQYALVNKAVLALAGWDAPMLVTAKNAQERKERLWKQLFYFGVVFMAAPLHAWFLSRYFGPKAFNPTQLAALKKINIEPGRLLQISSKHLHDLNGLRSGLTELFEKKLGVHLPDEIKHSIDEPFRQRLIKAKQHFWVGDLAIEGFFMGSIGWMINLASKYWISKGDQFSGEMRLAKESDLQELYEKEREKEWFSPKVRAAFTSIAGTLVPMGASLLVGHSLLRPSSTNSVLRLVKKLAPTFDYHYLKQVPLMGMGGLGLLAFWADTSDMINSRSPRERVENAFKYLATAVFMTGDLVWMKLFGRLF